ncbi:MAG TPA: (d)CMP kinase [Candidatus Binataceae bacterium]|nr:(d)CMP kinase [Candidatus Binataceae bacterium]
MPAASSARARPIVAIDGPVGAGKSTVARGLAQALGFSYVNTGAMYRAVALAARNLGIAPDDPQLASRLARLLRAIRISFAGDRLLLDGHDVSGELNAPEIGDLASQFSTLQVVRDAMRDLQRQAGAAGGVVMEGRDIGTAIFPDAEFKFFLDADVTVRARRRHAELVAKGVEIAFDEVLAQLRERDHRDRGRELAPLRQASDAMSVDASMLSADQVVKLMKQRIESESRQ